MSASDSTRPAPLQVTIVGAGIGGLSVAIALRKAGHHHTALLVRETECCMQVFESSEIKTEMGAGIGFQANSIRVLKSLGYKRENMRGGAFEGLRVFDAQTAEGKEIPSISCHRSDVHNEFRRLATEEGLEGPPVELCLGSKVVSCDPDAGTITLENGETATADLVVGADGVHSIVRSSILGQEVHAEPTGWACFRCLFDASKLSEYPELEWLTKNVASVRLQGQQLSEYIVYLLRNGTLVNFVAFHRDERDAQQPIAQTVSKESVLAHYPAFHPTFLRLFDLPLATPIIRWQLRAMPILPTWIKGRAVIIGDAAHATLPLLAQGAAMAVEEAGCLGVLFPAGTTPEQVPARLEAFQVLRKERGEFVNVQSVAQAEPGNRVKFIARESDNLQFDSTGTERDGFSERELQSYLTDYDALKTAEEYYNAHFGAGSDVSA
ncbi:FAD/NAD(P)-binding domain-containing protein [Mycena amicta]|nr:FAD/NAD(P)-binding domain-containing protein [Mycena amicta]